jgi:sulfur carrier protein ThiS
VLDLLATLAISADDVGVLIVNSRDATYRQRLTDGDRVTLIPAIGGG